MSRLVLASFTIFFVDIPLKIAPNVEYVNKKHLVIDSVTDFEFLTLELYVIRLLKEYSLIYHRRHYQESKQCYNENLTWLLKYMCCLIHAVTLMHAWTRWSCVLSTSRGSLSICRIMGEYPSVVKHLSTNMVDRKVVDTTALPFGKRMQVTYNLNLSY